MTTENIDLIKEWLHRALLAKRAAHQALAVHEQASSRVIILEDLLKNLSGLPLDIQDYFREAVACVEGNLLRAAVVLSWAGFMHVLIEYVYTKYKAQIRQVRPNWQFKDLSELKEKYVEYQLLETAQKVRAISKTELKVYQGQLAERNRCAHPTLYKPSLNSALGYVDTMLRQTFKYITT